MSFSSIAKIIGLFLILFSTSMLPPILVNAVFHQTSAEPFFAAFLVTYITGVVLWYPFRKKKVEMKVRDGFLIVVLFWTVLGLFGSLPLYIAPIPKLSFVDALFESISGLTTTGATILYHIDSLPNAIRFYRQELQFIGGMGIIVLAVAVLPMLGIGGMQLFRAETPGPLKDAKLTPRIQETAKALWYIYVGLTLICAFLYWLSGMSFFDAIGESFSTVSTGGFSMHDASFGFYHNYYIDIVAVVFMILGGTNFALHFTAFRTKSLFTYLKDVEFVAYLWFMFIVFAITLFTLFMFQHYESFTDTLCKTLFNVVSLITTTGLVSTPFANWPSFLPILIMLVAIVGGCAASTSGGIKVLRMVLLGKQSNREIKRLIHPQGVFAIKFGGQILPEHVVEAIWGFIAMFLILFIFILLLLMVTGVDFLTAFGATVAVLSNAGASIGQVAVSFDPLHSFAKWVLMLGMLLGRLEIFTVLILFSPEFWRR